MSQTTNDGGPVPGKRTLRTVLGARIDVIDWQRAIDTIRRWAEARESRYICICNVHSVMTAARDPSFQRIINEADMATADGAPIAWMLRRLGALGQQRINGPDLMWRYCEQATQHGESIFLFGNTESTLAKLVAALKSRYPALRIVGTEAPPFREMTPAEDQAVIEKINRSGAGTVWVSLGCPKQERWMSAHRGRIQAVMVGVGAAFDYHAGAIRRAPDWMQRSGLEWLHRLASEPRRLGGRYLRTNSAFIIAAARQLMNRGPEGR